MRRHLPFAFALMILGGLTACETLPPGAPLDPDDPATWHIPVGGDGSDCTVPGAGCACEDAAPISCFLMPVEVDGVAMCRRGTRYCRDQVWTACESVHEYELYGAQALVTGPAQCEPCDPSCAESIDTPDTADLPGHSTDIVYNASAGGIQLDSMMMTTTPPLPDSDGDGIPDVADDCVGPGAFQNADGSCYGDVFFYHSLSYGAPPEIDPLDINVQVRTADVYFLMDVTGSMGGEIANLKSALTSGTFITGCSGGVIGAIRCTIPDAWFGVGRFGDFSVSPFGGGADVPYANLQDISASLTAAQTAVNTMNASGGSDTPEANFQAIYATASGNGLGGYLSARTGCPAGTWGYPCFRDGTIPILIHITDAPGHNGSLGYDYYGFTGHVPYATTVSTLTGRSVRVISIVSGTSGDAYNDAVNLANATGSTNGSGTPYVYSVAGDGTGLDTSIVNAVLDLANYNRIDISARATDDASTPAVDERNFVTGITANSWGAGSCTGISGGNTFIQCLPGTDVNFTITFENTFVMPTMTTQVFDFFIEVVGDGAFVIDRIPVRIIVPALVPVYPPSGSYFQNYDSTLYCAGNERPDWGDLTYTFASLPAGTSAEFEIRASDMLSTLASATPVVVNVGGLTGTVNVGNLLDAAMVPVGLPYLRVTAVLYSDAMMTSTPVLQSFQLRYSCVPVE
ncbi:MAG: hypothetical protein AB7S26_34025 [Sandaracinaceae bacterium]